MAGDITDIKRGLAQRAQSVAEMLLPRGRKEGSEWRVGSLQGEPGQSLGVHLTGNKAGLWMDFASKESGDLIDLWQQTTGLKLIEVLDRAREYLGMETPKEYRDPQTPRKVFKVPPKPKCSRPQGRALDYLREVRNISAETIAAYKIGEDAKGNIVFPFIKRDGVVALAKSREPKDGAKPIPTAKDCEPILFGWQAVPEDARVAYITEGEIDALSMCDYGYPAFSVPFGGGGGNKQQWIENEFENLWQFERIYLVFDDDEQGDEGAAEIARRLGRHRCLRVRLPKKDANECLMNGVVKEEIAKAIDNAESLDPEGLKRPLDFVQDIEDLFYPPNDQPVGYYMPYSKFGFKLLFRPGELTLWSGAAGAGKSQLLSDCTIDWVKQGSRICIASFEMHPRYTLKRMVKQASNMDRPSREYIRKTLGWLDQGVLLYERVGKQDVESLLEIFDYARAKYGCDQFIIDSLMRLGLDSDDYSAQEKALYKLVDWVIRHDVHIHLVAHSRKGEKNSGVPETEDVKGAMEIGANAFNIITVWRDRKKEDEIRAELDVDKRKALIAEDATVVVNTCKQRNGDWEGKVGLWFSTESYRYSGSPDGDRMRNYLIDDVQVAA